MAKKIFLFLLMFSIILPNIALAAAGTYNAKQGGTDIPVCYEGFVPCGKNVAVGGSVGGDGKCTGGTPTLIYCQFCHFFVMLNNIIKYILGNIVPPLAILFLVIAGVLFYTSQGKPDATGKARKAIEGVVIGLTLVYGAYMLVGLFLSVLGVAEWTGLAEWAKIGPFSISCPISI